MPFVLFPKRILTTYVGIYGSGASRVARFRVVFDPKADHSKLRSSTDWRRGRPNRNGGQQPWSETRRLAQPAASLDQHRTNPAVIAACETRPVRLGIRRFVHSVRRFRVRCARLASRRRCVCRCGCTYSDRFASCGGSPVGPARHGRPGSRRPSRKISARVTRLTSAGTILRRDQAGAQLSTSSILWCAIPTVRSWQALRAPVSISGSSLLTGRPRRQSQAGRYRAGRADRADGQFTLMPRGEALTPSSTPPAQPQPPAWPLAPAPRHPNPF